jgi:hypothetical protein
VGGWGGERGAPSELQQGSGGSNFIAFALINYEPVNTWSIGNRSVLKCNAARYLATVVYPFNILCTLKNSFYISFI